MTGKSVNIGQSIKRALLFLVVSTVALYIGLAGVTYWAWRGQQENRAALCALRADLERRVATSREFLKEHPRGIPGISAMTIRNGISNQERTIEALGDISC